MGGAELQQSYAVQCCRDAEQMKQGRIREMTRNEEQKQVRPPDRIAAAIIISPACRRRERPHRVLISSQIGAIHSMRHKKYKTATGESGGYVAFHSCPRLRFVGAEADVERLAEVTDDETSSCS